MKFIASTTESIREMFAYLGDTMLTERSHRYDCQLSPIYAHHSRDAFKAQNLEKRTTAHHTGKP